MNNKTLTESDFNNILRYDNEFKVDMNDDIAVLYSAIYSHPELAALLNENLEYLSAEQVGDALFYAAMGDQESLMRIIGTSQHGDDILG